MFVHRGNKYHCIAHQVTINGAQLFPEELKRLPVFLKQLSTWILYMVPILQVSKLRL